MRVENTHQTPSSPGITVSLEELIHLRHEVLEQTSKKNWQFRSSGQKALSFRTRGIEFDRTHEYRSGDDIRHMAWRITARQLKPHVKVYQEEIENPVWLALDLSPSLYFGTRCMFKSVAIIKQAAYLGWSNLLKSERIGAVIATEHPRIFKPQKNENHFLTILNAFSYSSQMIPAFDEKNYLANLLTTLQKYMRSGQTIFILSDFFHFDQIIQKLILQLKKHAQIILFFIYDPFESESPPPYRYILTNGYHSLLCDMSHPKNRLQYEEAFKIKNINLRNFSFQYGIPLYTLCTNQPFKRNIRL